MRDDQEYLWTRIFIMTSEEKAALENHLNAIAKILYANSDPSQMQTLEGIEVTVRQQIQQHVSPELGRFLSENLRKQK
jgi:hypothetical protein